MNEHTDARWRLLRPRDEAQRIAVEWVLRAAPEGHGVRWWREPDGLRMRFAREDDMEMFARMCTRCCGEMPPWHPCAPRSRALRAIDAIAAWDWIGIAALGMLLTWASGCMLGWWGC